MEAGTLKEPYTDLNDRFERDLIWRAAMEGSGYDAIMIDNLQRLAVAPKRYEPMPKAERELRYGSRAQVTNLNKKVVLGLCRSRTKRITNA